MALDTSPSLLSRGSCILVIIDAQEKLLPAIADNELVLSNLLRLAFFCNIIHIPVILTEQIKLGPTVSDLRKALPDSPVILKDHFNCFYSDSFLETFRLSGKSSLILAGVEAHICVSQTALHALSHSTVHVISDAISSRSPHNKKVALSRLGHAGAIISSTEMFIYEVLQRAGNDEFKSVLPLIK